MVATLPPNNPINFEFRTEWGRNITAAPLSRCDPKQVSLSKKIINRGRYLMADPVTISDNSLVKFARSANDFYEYGQRNKNWEVMLQARWGQELAGKLELHADSIHNPNQLVEVEKYASCATGIINEPTRDRRAACLDEIQIRHADVSIRTDNHDHRNELFLEEGALGDPHGDTYVVRTNHDGTFLVENKKTGAVVMDHLRSGTVILPNGGSVTVNNRVATVFILNGKPDEAVFAQLTDGGGHDNPGVVNGLAALELEAAVPQGDVYVDVKDNEPVAKLPAGMTGNQTP
jgi:hypothetical protein